MNHLCKILTVLLGATLLFSSTFALAEDDTLTSGDFTYALLEDGTAEITGYTGAESTLILPDELDGIPVTSIGDSSIRHNGEITEVAFPDSVTHIGMYAFADCSGLTHIDIPGNVLTIGNGAFEQCENLASVTIAEGVTTLGSNLFGHCDALVDVNLPNSIELVENNPFFACEKLETISLSSDHPYLELINGVLFSKPDHRLICFPPALDCAEYSIPDGTEIVAGDAIRFNESLTTLAIPSSVTTLEGCAICNCHNLSDVTISEGLRHLGLGMFGDSAVTRVRLPDSLESVDKYWGMGMMGERSIEYVVGPDSFARQVCEENDMPFVLSSEVE